MCCGSKRTGLKNSLSTTAATSNRPLAGAQRGIELGRTSTAPTASSSLVNPAVQAQISPSGTTREGSFIAISYLGKAPVRVRGLTTGRAYDFSASDPVREVDARDASTLLNTRFFRRT
jgi:hypothetical protein